MEYTSGNNNKKSGLEVTLVFFNKKAGVLDKLNVESSHMLWRSLVDRNITIEHFHVLKNFVYDKSFKKHLEKIIDDYKNEADKLVKLLNKYSVPSPDPSPSDQNVSVSTEFMNDRSIAEVLYRFMRLDVSVLMLGMKETPTNEDIYEYFGQLARASITRLDDFIEYMKAKNWIYFPPPYRHANPETEEVASHAIYLLWDHLVFRYTNIRLTQILSVYVNDQIFNAMLTAGIEVLQSEVKVLEKELLYFGCTLPKPYPSTTVRPQDSSMFDDRYIFNQILRGLQDAVPLHGTTIQDTITNDRLRKLFIKLTFRELSLLDKLIKYGKAQGWTNLTPEY